jgi:hypothetical protein
MVRMNAWVEILPTPCQHLPLALPVVLHHLQNVHGAWDAANTWWTVNYHSLLSYFLFFKTILKTMT